MLNFAKIFIKVIFTEEIQMCTIHAILSYNENLQENWKQIN